MKAEKPSLNRLFAKRNLRSALAVMTSLLLVCGIELDAQCPNTGETKVIKPRQGTGYYFYKFIGGASYVYFLDGKTFRFNDKDDPGKLLILIDDFAYEPILFNGADLAKYVHSKAESEILRDQAKHEQEYFKKTVPSMAITDYGPSARKNADGSDGRLFYLWKKENSPGDKETRQYLVSTVVNGQVVVLSFMPLKTSVSEDEVFQQIQTYTSRFDVVAADRCALVLSAPTAP